MTVTEAAKERIQTGITEIFTPKEYPKFLQFASHFTSFSFQNVVLMYMQAPDAEHVAGMFAWKQLTDEVIPPDQIPILVLYPEYDEENKLFMYTIRKVFDYKQIGTKQDERQLKLKRTCSSGSVYGYFKKYFEQETKMSVYPTDEAADTIDVSDNMLLMPKDKPSTEKFHMLFDYYLSLKEDKDNTKIVNGCVENTVRYLVYSYYGFEESKRIVFPYLQLIKDDNDKADIIKKSFEMAGKLIEFVDTFCFEHLHTKNLDEER